MEFAPNAATARVVVSLEIVGVKTVELIDFNAASTPTQTSFAGSYYFPSGTILKLVDVVSAPANQVISFSGHLVSRT